MLTLVKLTDAEYVLSAVAGGLEDYYMGIGESPGVWQGRWAQDLGLEGVVEAKHLRALVDGAHPVTGDNLLAGSRRRKVRAIDVTLSSPKSVSLLWAFGPPEVSAVASQSHVEAAAMAMEFLESKVAVARLQVDGVRTRVDTAGLAVATFMHRVSREGDPQLHTHDVVPNVVRRPDGSFCAIDAGPLHDWAKPVGSVYQEQLRRLLTERLGVEWGPDRNGCREMVGFSPQQLRAFSKRSAQIEAVLERDGERYTSPAERMRADEAASLATRRGKRHDFTPELLRERWSAEARAVGIDGPEQVRDRVCGRSVEQEPLSRDEVFTRLADPEDGLCAHHSRFGEAQVVAAVAAMGGGRLDVAAISELATDFLRSPHVVRLVDHEAEPGRRRPPQWSTVLHRELEDRVLAHLDFLSNGRGGQIGESHVDAAIAAEATLGDDQADAVRTLCGEGPRIRSLISPAGYGKTTAVHAAATAAAADDHPVLGVATTNRAVAELRDVGIEAITIARLGIDLDEGRSLPPGTVVILDEASQTSTADAEVVLAAVADTQESQLWALGDVRQAQAVRAGGLAAEIDRRGREGAIPAAVLTRNRRQVDATEREALEEYRRGHPIVSQAIRHGAGWEHQEPTPQLTRKALADAAVADIERLGAARVAVLAVSHADCEDLADRIRARLGELDKLGGDSITGPGWAGPDRHYVAGDRVLLHAPVGRGQARLHNGTAATVTAVHDYGLRVRCDDGREATLARAFVEGSRRDDVPNLSHAWCRTVDGAQGGTWEQVHLLGSAALDNFTTYVGQSRSRLPTHTWNVTPVIEVDYGGVLADRRSPDEVVLAAMNRAPLKAFAAWNDPHLIDRRLRNEIAEHQAVIDTRPPDRSRELDQARRAQTAAQQELRDAHALFGGASERLAAIGPLSRLRRQGRVTHERATAEVERAGSRLDDAQTAVVDGRSDVRMLETAMDRREQWDRQNGWRTEEVSRLKNQLARHWADATLAAVRDGDPLAFGTERLRHASWCFARELAAVNDTVPPDRSAALEHATAVADNAADVLSAAKAEHRQAGLALAEARQRRWGRRDKETVARAESRLERASAGLQRAGSALDEANAAVVAERTKVAKRQEALAAIAPERERLGAVVGEFRHALDSTRVERVAQMARTGIVDDQRLIRGLGPVPKSRGGVRVWCALAMEVEKANDRGQPLDDPVSRRGSNLRPWDDHNRVLIAAGAEHDPEPSARSGPGTPAHWSAQVHDADAIVNARDLELVRTRALERGLDRGLGIDLGR